MLPPTLLLCCLAAITAARAQDSTSSSTSPSSSASTTTTSSSRSQSTLDFGTDTRSFLTLTTNIPTSAFTGSDVIYLSYAGQSTVDTSTASSNSTATSTSSANSQITVSTTSPSLLVIGGITSSSTTNNGTVSSTTRSSTSSAAIPINTTPCNNYPEFCTRKYSNITEVCAHNSAFVVKNNVASNQQLSITQQLNDGVRMIQGETHIVNNTVYNCHTSCELLNAGTWQSMLETIVTWLESHPYEVVTVLIVNSDFAQGSTVTNYTAPIENSGIRQYLYEPEYVPQRRDQWPTLGEMILSGKRVVMFMDYNANQTEVPYVLDEFTHMWETPFSPVDQAFPCTQERPPGLNATAARDDYMYLANHNLNLGIDVGAILGSGDDTILIPDTSALNQTNGAGNQYGYLDAASSNCTAQWGNPPNFLLVDYYNIGQTNGSLDAGSVFQVAAQANNVTYNRACCGTTASAAGPSIQSRSAGVVLGMMTAVMVMLLA